MANYKPADIEYFIEKINSEARGLSKWQSDFMDSITEQWNERHSLSERQVEVLERIYADKTP